jgi:hypothetical protein
MLGLLAVNLVLYCAFIPETKGHSLVDHMPEKREKISFFKRGNPSCEEEKEMVEARRRRENSAALLQEC